MYSVKCIRILVAGCYTIGMYIHDTLPLLKGMILQLFPYLDSAPRLSDLESRPCALEAAEGDELLDSSDTQVDWSIDSSIYCWDGERNKKNEGWDEVIDQDIGEEEDSLVDDRQEVYDEWGPGIVYSPRPVKEQLTWVSPLPEFFSLAEADIIKAGGENSEFLSRFLADKREGDITFEQSHGLVNSLLRAVTACAFDTIQRWAPHDLLLMEVQGPDQLELQWWLRMLSDISHRCPKPAETVGTDWELLSASIADRAVGQVRHTAVHRLSYSTKLIKDSVNFLIALNDLERFRQVERTVRTLYGTISGTFAVSDEETSALASALQLYPTECRTTLDLFYTISGILENAYFRRSKIDDQDWLITHKVIVAEQMELYRPEAMAWSLLHGRDDGISILRNNVAHRSGYIGEATLDLEQIHQAVGDLREVALSLDDEDAAAQIVQVSEAAMMQLQARSAAYEAFLNDSSAQDLRAMSREAAERFNKWNPTKWDLSREVAKHTIAHRYLKASQTFRALAALKDGTHYREELWYLRSKANTTHERWQTAQCARFEDAKLLLRPVPPHSSCNGPTYCLGIQL